MTTFLFDRYELDVDAYELRHDGELVAMEPQVFDVLAHLVTNRDRVVAKEELLDEVWGDRFVSESALTSRLKQARRAIGDDGRTQGRIKTIHGRGYRFIDTVEASDAQPEHATRVPSTPRARGPRLEIDTEYVTVDGLSIAYQVIGEGDTDLVFIPGFVSHLELQWEIPGFSDFMERLASFGRLIVMDKRGSGLSDRIPPTELPPLEDRIDDLLAILNQVGAERPVVLGVSEGGAMALLFAATHPERVRQLIVFGTYPQVDWATPDEQASFFDHMADRWGDGWMFGRLLAPSWANDPHMRRLSGRYERNAASPATARQVLELNARIDVTHVLSSIPCPTLILHRADDQFIPGRSAQTLADGIPNSQLTMLPGDDHLFAAGDIDALLDHVEQFVAGTRSQPAMPDRVLATVMLTDIVGSTELARTVGDDRWTTLLSSFHERGEETIGRHHGRLVKVMGDGLLAVFDGPARAVHCARELRRAAPGLGIELRSGVHTAEIELVDDDVAGIGVHICARVGALAAPGEVWVSRTVRDLVAGSGLVFDERGEHELRGVAETWPLYAVR